MREWIPKNWKQIVAWLLMALAGWLARGEFNPGPPPLPIWQDSFGWIEDQAAVEKVAKGLRFRWFSDTPAGEVAMEDLPKQVYLWDAFRKKTGQLPPVKNQRQVGSCVSFGTNNAITRSLMCAIVAGAPYEFKDIVEEVTYAGSRVQIGQGRISGDGSVGAWAAQFVQKYGVVAREKHLDGKYDLSVYSESLCRAWGRSGVPADLIPVCKERPVKEITQVRTTDEAKKAIAQGYAIAVCSNQGFSMQRDANGVSKPSGSWAHCMCIDGYHVAEDGKLYFHIENSWGPDSHKGPVGWGNPGTGGFWAESGVVSRMLAQDDSWAFSSVTGFPRRELDWFVRVQPQPQDRRQFAEGGKNVRKALFDRGDPGGQLGRLLGLPW